MQLILYIRSIYTFCPFSVVKYAPLRPLPIYTDSLYCPLFFLLLSSFLLAISCHPLCALSGICCKLSLFRHFLAKIFANVKNFLYLCNGNSLIEHGIIRFDMNPATRTPMRSVVISFNPHDKKAAQFIETAKLMDFFHVKDRPYDPAYVADVKAMDKSTFQPLDIDDLWK